MVPFFHTLFTPFSHDFHMHSPSSVLLNIEIDHVIVDELNLLLHEMDVMLDNIITEVIDWDKEDDFEKTCTQQKGLHLKKLEREIKSCGVG